MKDWAVTILVVIGGYAVFRWFTHFGPARRLGYAGNLVGMPSATAPNLAAQNGIGNYAITPIASGVPSFSELAISNGHGDQVAAAYHTNVFATIPGGPVYVPAFGPNENQNGGLSVF